MESQGITHRMVQVNDITMHVAEKGEGPPVLLIHGFPELWYSWRHQILGLAARGYRAIAPDLRGYGDTSAPPSVASYSVFHIVGDVIALLDALAIPEVFVVGHDWGAIISWYVCLFRPDRVKALVNLSVAFSPFLPRNPQDKLVGYFRSLYGDDYYVCKFQELGAVEADFARIGTENLLRVVYSNRDPGPLHMRKENFGPLTMQIPLPSWLSEEDIRYYASKFEKSGFTGPVNYYRCLDLNWELGAPWYSAQVKVPVKFIVGDLDLTYHYPGIQDYLHKGGFKQDVPLLEEVVVLEGVAHFINQEKADEVTEHIYDFIRKF
ncbi:bifunctional epoxide hydrolase 2 [Canna indica]|uniref:soluble epoxide hydrolase n=1 Tax=Canna indica TaxID=4628 RepID=A0AAQ3K8N5_9LILI|nr:bifunctional epoxide hydrolase 2 [Canna indica]